MSEKYDQDALENAEEIIKRFGGIRPMANKLDAPVTTVQGWKKRNVIPANRRDQVLAAAAAYGIDLSDLAGTVPSASAAPRRSEPAAAPIKDTHVQESRVKDTPVKDTHGEIMKDIQIAQQRAVTQSVWLSLGLFVLVGALGAFLLWPTQQQVEDNTMRLSSLEREVSDIRENGSLLDGLVPGDVRARFEELRGQAEHIQGTVTRLSREAEQLAGDIRGDLAGSGDLAQRLARLEQRIERMGAPADLAALIARLRGLQESAQGQNLIAASADDLKALLGQLQGQDEELEQALATAQQDEEGALGEALQGIPPHDLKAAALLIGLTQFRTSLNRSGPFEDDLALMQRLVGSDDPALNEAIARLAPQAERGVLSVDGLSSQLRGLSGDIVTASLQGEEIGARERAAARLHDVLQVKKDGETLTGTQTQITITKAQALLDEGDVSGAIATLQTLDGEAAQTARPWIDEAQMKLLADQVQTMMSGRVATELTRSSGGTMATPDAARRLLDELRKLGTGAQGRVISDETGTVNILTR